MAGSIRVAGHTIAEHDIANDKVDIKNATLASSVKFSSFVGLILPFAYDTSGSPPSGFFECDGSPVSRTAYSDLFSAIGTTWGAGDGSTTFNLPDLQGAFLRGTGSHGSSTMANSSAFTGQSVGSFENDQFQGFQVGGVSSGTRYGIVTAVAGTETGTSAVGNNNSAIPYYNFAYAGNASMLTALNDGTNGNPRKGDETRPFNAGVMYCIKY